jgi:hypothetical protein
VNVFARLKDVFFAVSRIAADFPHQINQRNNGGKCADDLTDGTNRFPIHGMT